MAETKTTKTTTTKTAVKTPAKTATKSTAKTTATKSTVAKATTAKTTTKAVEKKAPAKTAAAKTTKPAEVKVVPEVKEVKAAKQNQKHIKVTLVRSTIGYDKRQGRIVEALGLGKLNSSHVLPDNPCVRGMIFHVKHLVRVEELN